MFVGRVVAVEGSDTLMFDVDDQLKSQYRGYGPGVFVHQTGVQPSNDHHQPRC